jgi:heme/copper-type cytochrome/quinol oxidase subunit 3
VALAMVFVGYQAAEFARLLGIGFTLQSSAHGGFFYTIVGAHALHALTAVLALAWGARAHQAGTLTAQLFAALRIYWYFVVLLWPVLFAVVYL